MRGGARMMEMLMKDITLDAAQKSKVEAIQAKYAKELPAMTPGERPSPEDMAKRREIQMKQRDEIRGVLTAEQQAVFDKNIAALRDRMRQ
jgi:Spy/CpxP family protein refolding chaperone